jgi:hypothetical protein
MNRQGLMTEAGARRDEAAVSPRLCLAAVALHFSVVPFVVSVFDHGKAERPRARSSGVHRVGKKSRQGSLPVLRLGSIQPARR